MPRARLHYDLRLECDGVLKSWAVPKGPSLDPADKRLAVPTEDHPFDYASFEGVIPRGPVRRRRGHRLGLRRLFARRRQRVLVPRSRGGGAAACAKASTKGKLSFMLRGEKLKGSFALVRTTDGKSWLLIKHKDRFAAKVDVTAQDRSVLSGVDGRGDEGGAGARMPAERLVPDGQERADARERSSPMHAELADAPFNRADWMWEPKLDGYRALAFIGTADGVRLRSRRGLELAGDFPRLGAELAQQAVSDNDPRRRDRRVRRERQAVVQRACRTAPAKTERAVFYCFDLLHFAGIDLREAPYRDRRRYLAQCLLPSPLVQLVHAVETASRCTRRRVASGFEGVIGKRKDSRYEAGRRSGAWLKVKATQQRGFRDRRLHAGARARAPRSARCLSAIGRAASCATRPTSARASTTVRCSARESALEPLRRNDRCPSRRSRELNGPTTWVEARSSSPR